MLRRRGSVTGGVVHHAGYGEELTEACIALHQTVV